jgi:hypothetical protein
MIQNIGIQKIISLLILKRLNEGTVKLFKMLPDIYNTHYRYQNTVFPYNVKCLEKEAKQTSPILVGDNFPSQQWAHVSRTFEYLQTSLQSSDSGRYYIPMDLAFLRWALTGTGLYEALTGTQF